MVKGDFAKSILVLAITATVTASPIYADEGCDVLREVVIRAVGTASHDDGTALPPVTPAKAGEVGSIVNGRLICTATAKEASRAFSQAFAARNVLVSWNKGLMHGEGHCMSNDLQQCYPTQDQLVATLLPAQLALLEAVWHGVRSAVASQMPFGTGNGVSVFTAASLESALSSKLYSSAPTTRVAEAIPAPAVVSKEHQ